jgi:heme/copper-type cytochrome/quinol oxidase subunit 2
MIPDEELEVGDLRLLETDEVVFLPTNIRIGFVATSDDVIHS